ncbi:MAG: tetratricopeptide repeat protein [Deltaproteobacteria bacterium]|nr:tetratricopeptide repeat protein [Deltaproteobacteria bacterium]
MRWWVIVGILIHSATAAAGDLQDAQDLFNRMKYAQAQAIAERVLVSSKSEPGDLVQAYMIKGLCLSARGEPDEALVTFRKLLAIDPEFEMPKNVSPKLAAPFSKAVPMPIKLVHEPPAQPKASKMLDGFELRISLVSDSMSMVAAVRLRFQIEGGQELMLERAASGHGELAFKLPPGLKVERVTYYFEAINGHGGVLVRAGHRSEQYEIRPAPETEEIAEVPEQTQAKEQVQEKERLTESREGLAQQARPWLDPVWAHTALWTGVGLIGLAGVATWQAKEAGDQYSRSYGEDTEAGKRSQTWAGVMYAGYIGGAVLAATGTLLWILSSEEEQSESESVPSLGLLPVDGGAMVTFGERW